MKAANKKLNNRLWQARKRAGLEQKQVARLLGHKTCDQISRYERGVRVPSFQTALKLELIYRTPLRNLFPDHFGKFSNEVSARHKQMPTMNAVNGISAEETQCFCAVSVLLDKSRVNALEIDSVRKHALALHQKLSEAIHRTKFPPD